MNSSSMASQLLTKCPTIHPFSGTTKFWKHNYLQRQMKNSTKRYQRLKTGITREIIWRNQYLLGNNPMPDLVTMDLKINEYILK